MDPLSITTSVTALAALCGQVVMLCSRIPGRQASIHRTLINLKKEVSTYQTSLCLIEELLIDQDSVLAKILGAKNEWTESFDTALSGCSITISILISMLENIIASCTGSSFNFTLKEQDLKDLIGELRGQNQGVQLLLQTLQLRSTAEVFQLLSENGNVLNEVRNQTDRLAKRWGIRNLDTASQAADAFSVLSLDLDEEISKLGPYLRAFSEQRRQQSEMRQATANLIDDNLIDLTPEAESPGQWTMELHREFSFPRNGNPDAEDQGSESSEELYIHTPGDVEKEPPIGMSHLSSVPEDTAFKEIEVAGDRDDKSFEVYLDEAIDPLHVQINGQDGTREQPRDISKASLGWQSVALSSVEFSQPFLPVFQLYNCHLTLPPEFQNRRRSSNSVASTEAISLQWAVVQGYLDIAKTILRKSGASRGLTTHRISVQVGENVVAFDGWTALSLAAYFGHLPVVEYFLQHPGSTIADQSQARNGSTLTSPPLLPPLYAAVASVPYLMILNGLTSSNSSSNVSANQDLLAITDLKLFRTQRPDLWRSRTSNSDEDMRLKIFSFLSAADHPAFSMDVQDRNKFNLIHAAACGTSLAMVKTILDLRGKQKTSQKRFSLSKFKIGQRTSDIFPDTPLHLAAFWNRTETVKLLLQRSTSPNISGYRNRTPLHYAAAMGNVEVIQILLNAKANFDVEDSGTHRPLDLAFQWGQWEAMTALIQAGSDLFRITTYNRDHRLVTETILHTAVRVYNASRIEAVRILLENGAVPNYPNNRLQTPLHFAIEALGPRLGLIQCLIEYNADPNVKDGDGNTPLHLAIMKGSNGGTAHSVVQTLLDAKANPCLKNNSGRDAVALTRDCIAPITKSTPQWRKNSTQTHHINDYLKIVDMFEAVMPESIRRQSSLSPPLAQG